MEEQPQTPPANADDWSDQQWIDWLKASDAEPGSVDHTTPVTTGGRVARSAGGQVLGNAMMGLAQALYGRQEEKPAIIAEADEPGADQPLDVHLDFDHPERSFATLKPVPLRPDRDAD